MRILHVLNHTRRQNGNVHAALDLACAQVKLGHAVAVCSGGGDFDAMLTANGIEIMTIDQRRRIVTAFRAVTGLAGAMRRWHADIVHAHMMTSAVLCWPATRWAGIPLVTTVHNAFERSAVVMAVGDRVIAVSQAVAASMRKRGIPARRLRIVLNGTVGSARRPLPLPHSKDLSRPAIVYVGGLHPRKGIDVLLDAMAIVTRAVPHAHLYLVGEGPCRSAYEQQASRLELAGRVTFGGSTLDPRPYLQSADVFVLPSRSDPAPLVICEAREAGCAIVASAVDGIPELLDDGAAGLLCRPGDPRALAQAMLDLVADPGTLARYAQRARVGLDRFSVERVARDTLQIYADVLRAPRPERAVRNTPGSSSMEI